MASSKALIGIGVGAAVAIAVVIAFAMNNNDAPAATNETSTKKIKVIASFFPLYEFSSKVGGDRAEISTMVPPGIEPHDWEPTPRQIEDARAADMLVYNGAGFEKWAETIDGKFTVNTSEGIDLMAGEEEHSAFDPHIWLDPMLAKYQVEKIREGFVKTDSANADYYNANAAKFTSELDSLDSFIKSGLSSCEKTDFIAFHNAFSYFANRYGLEQHSVHEGLSPEGEILPQRIEELVELAKDLDINVIYSEELVDPRLAQVIADEIPNGQVLVLSPLEGLEEEDQKAGLGYIEKMKENVSNLRQGLSCS